MLKKIILLCGAIITILLLWFAVHNYRDSLPLADETLFGLAHSIHAAIENSVQHDPSLATLSTFTTHDIAYFALIDAKGVYRFHTNSELIGTALHDTELLKSLSEEKMRSKRMKLNSGEEVYELITPLRPPPG